MTPLDLQFISPCMGKYLQTRRKRKRLTQAQLAEKVGCHVNTIRALEHSCGTASFELVMKVCIALLIFPSKALAKAENANPAVIAHKWRFGRFAVLTHAGHNSDAA